MKAPVHSGDTSGAALYCAEDLSQLFKLNENA